ncbi:2006_t:CDS:2 [Paraglomus brasilianum]|uniref:2006_t:CDS:1 n=1 Tax=Paraglomus brasilianum TaxID=144538 RepID=A0A9N9E7F6_9GLOM|nr:2006_t:CDS:2 [Paraglomus brasilianum]
MPSQQHQHCRPLSPNTDQLTPMELDQPVKTDGLEEQHTLLPTAKFVQLEENKEELLQFNGKINGNSTWILLNSGASRNFISKNFVQRHCLSQTPTAKVTVELAN